MKAESPIHPDDLPDINRMHAEYLADEDGTQTSAASLQAEAYCLGRQRARQEVAPALKLLQHVRTHNASGLSMSTREAIDALMLAE